MTNFTRTGFMWLAHRGKGFHFLSDDRSYSRKVEEWRMSHPVRATYRFFDGHRVTLHLKGCVPDVVRIDDLGTIELGPRELYFKYLSEHPFPRFYQPGYTNATYEGELSIQLVAEGYIWEMQFYREDHLPETSLYAFQTYEEAVHCAVKDWGLERDTGWNFKYPVDDIEKDW